MTNLSTPEIKICPVCQVTLNNNLAHYKVGKPSNLEYLGLRVCQYAKGRGCINQYFQEQMAGRMLPGGYELDEGELKVRSQL